MRTTTVLFDLDGTLLPMDQDRFVRAYFGLLARTMAPLGYAPEKLLDVIIKGIQAMVQNDGAATNEDVFWRVFCEAFGEQAREDMPRFETFYRNEFQQAKAACGFDPRAAQTIHAIKDKGFRVVLATNPLFPRVATHSRIRWAGLEPQNFELVTTYENSRFCKPDLRYYEEILGKLQVQPGECLMVGNDADEDMVAERLGMRVFLLTDCLINRQAQDVSRWPRGSFDALMAYVQELAAQK